MSYPIRQAIQTHNRSGRKLKAVGMMVHETATPGATDENETKYMSSTTRKASVHFFIDWDSITQTIPLEEIAWHAGPTANSRYISAELCHAKTREQFEEVWKRAVWLFGWVFVSYLKLEKVTQQTLPSHHDATNWWHETAHVDPDGYFAEFGKTVADFRSDVQKEIDRQLGKSLVISKPARMSVGLEITASTLNCRKGPGTNYEILKKFKRGDDVTAIGEEKGWWRLDINGTPGYISKQYTSPDKD